jgi:hypothetical protein
MGKHKSISFIKSMFRLVGAGFGIAAFWYQFYPMHAFALLFIAEIFGIAEEFFETKPSLKEIGDVVMSTLDKHFTVPETASPEEILEAWRAAHGPAGKAPNVEQVAFFEATQRADKYSPKSDPEVLAVVKEHTETFHGIVPKMVETPVPFVGGMAHEPKGS